MNKAVTSGEWSRCASGVVLEAVWMLEALWTKVDRVDNVHHVHSVHKVHHVHKKHDYQIGLQKWRQPQPLTGVKKCTHF